MTQYSVREKLIDQLIDLVTIDLEHLFWEYHIARMSQKSPDTYKIAGSAEVTHSFVFRVKGTYSKNMWTYL